MKSILIIGMGRFGRHLCQNLAELGNQIMIVDQEEENLEDMLPLVVSDQANQKTSCDKNTPYAKGATTHHLRSGSFL